MSAAILLSTIQAIGAPGDIDTDFGTDGKVVFEQTTGNTEIWGQLLSLPNGKIVVCGVVDTGSVMVRLNSNGTADTGFGGTGQIPVRFGNNSRVNSITATTDGKIIAAGSESYSLNDVQMTRFAVAMISQDGSLDPAFGGAGQVSIDIPGSVGATSNDVVVTPEGKILLSGGDGKKSILVRLTSSGFLDTSFSGDGIAVFDFVPSSGTSEVSGYEHIGQSLIQPDGKILSVGNVATNDIHVFRIHTDGSLDTTFGSHGRLRIDIRGDIDTVSSMALLPDGGVVMTGSTGWVGMNSLFIALNSDGSFRDSFGNGGILEIDVGGADQMSDLKLMPDGRILASGSCELSVTTQFAAVRLMPDGSFDPLFGSGGILRFPSSGNNDAALAIARDGAGKILILGRTGSANLTFGGTLLRLVGDPDSDGDGIPDSSETGTGIYVSPFDTGTDPHNPDTDGDGLSDGDEVFKYFTNPILPDTDGDGFIDGYEVQTGKSPTDPTDKPALVAEVRTAIEFTFPTAIGKTYRIEASPDMTAWSAIEENITGTGSAITRFYTTRNMPKRFLRVEEQGQP
jgi:uncharacterized delta-60 repeat protein